MWLWNRWLGQPTKREADKNRAHKHTHASRLARSPQLAHTKQMHAHTHIKIHYVCPCFVLSLPSVLISDLVFHSHSVSSWMQVSCWLFAVFCLQGPRGLVGPRGSPGPPGQPVSQHRLDYRIKAIELLRLYKSLSSAWIINMLLRWTGKRLNCLYFQILTLHLLFSNTYWHFCQGIHGTDGVPGSKGNPVSPTTLTLSQNYYCISIITG